jgi:ketosteroid isomerase-like protein
MTLSAADRLEILDVISRADWAASRRDAAAYADLFTDDVVLDGAQGRHAGQDALRAWSGRSGPRKDQRACTSRSTPSSRRGKPPMGTQ